MDTDTLNLIDGINANLDRLIDGVRRDQDKLDNMMDKLDTMLEKLGKLRKE